MSSLPQGWHGISGPSKPASGSGGVSGSSVPVTIRKKWNSPLSSNVPQTRLPAYKSSNLKTQATLNNTHRIKSTVTACPISQTKVPSPVKPSPVKEYQNEVAKLKQELSTIKAENSILKAKVRRVDDENLQKGRQIEKMRTEIKTLQKNESANNRKIKESQELLLLRQKCLRLENALKEKDLAIKKLTSELSMKKDDPDSMKSSSMGLQKQICPTSTSRLPRNSYLRYSEKPSSAKSSQSRASQSLKTEVTKLRDMIHKLEKENQDLQQQAKLHCQEIRRLKVQLKSKDKLASQTSVSRSSTATEQMKNSRNKSVLTVSNSQASSQNKVGENLFVPKQRLMTSKKSPLQYSIAHNSICLTSHTVGKQVKCEIASPQKIRKVTKVADGTIKRNNLNKITKDNSSKLPLTKQGFPSSSKPTEQKTAESIPVHAVRNLDLEFKIQEMRENIAAKKIQRSWRQHQKNLQHSTVPEFQTEEKALSFIISSIKHHKSRKEKLSFLVKKKNVHSQNLSKELFIEAVEASRQKIWEQACT